MSDKKPPSNDDKPPALPAMMLIAIMEEIAEGEVIITERLRKKKELEAFRNREDVSTVLDIEAEVGQEVFVYAVKLIKTAIGQRVADIRAIDLPRLAGPGNDFERVCEEFREKVIEAIDKIKPMNPYAGEK
jgi:hypothetical protein